MNTMSVSAITAVSGQPAKARRQDGQSAVSLFLNGAPRAVIGTVLENRFKLTELIYSSGVSDVFRARDLATNRNVVAKFGDFLDVDKMVERESGVIANLPGIFYPEYISHGENYLVIEHLNGVSLAEVINKRKDMPLHKMIDLALSIMYGLAVLHKEGFVHCDIKPQNIFIDGDKIFIFDFGLTGRAGFYNREDQEKGKLRGTAQYMPPEQLDNQPLDPRMDFYAMGIVIYQMLTGINPKMGMNYPEVFANHREKDMPRLAKEVITQRYEPAKRTGIFSRIKEFVRNRTIGKLHATLAGLIEGMTKREIDARFGNIDEIIGQLQKASKLAAKLASYEIA
jgi:serine/threonine protein kinase